MRRLAFAVTAIGIFLVCSVHANAQGLSTILGTITDPSGSVVPEARITITQQETNQTRTLTTDTQGYYVFTTLRPASYTLSVEAPGFRKYRQENILLVADQSLTVNVKLELGETNQTVSVSAAGA